MKFNRQFFKNLTILINTEREDIHMYIQKKLEKNNDITTYKGKRGQ